MVPLPPYVCVCVVNHVPVWFCFWDVADSHLELLQASGSDRAKPTHFLSTLGVFRSVLLRPVPVQHRKCIWMMVAYWNINEGSAKAAGRVCVCDLFTAPKAPFKLSEPGFSKPVQLHIVTYNSCV